MAITREERFIYLSRNATTGLTNVTAVIRRNGTEVLGTGVTPLPLAEVDNGRYELVLSPAQLNSAGGFGFYDFYINSATKNAPGLSSKYITEKNQDDLDAHLTTIEGKVDSLQGDVTAVAVDVTSIKATVEDTNTEVQSPVHGLAQINNTVDALQSAISQIQNNTRFTSTIPGEMVIASSGAKAYRAWVGFFNTVGDLEDPDSNEITVSMQDESGNNRNDYLASSVASAAVLMTRDSLGIYFIDISIPDTAPEEQVITFFDYLENTIALKQVRTSLLKKEVNASGLALELTSQEIKVIVTEMQPRVQDIQLKINDAAFGLSAIRNANTAIQVTVDANNSILSDPTFGNAAILASITSGATQASVDAIDTKIDDDVKGTGFIQAEDTLHEISQRVFYGGTAV